MRVIGKIGLSFLFLFFIFLSSRHLDPYKLRVLNVTLIYVVFAVSYNFINGVCGQFSLAPNAFAAIGAYVSALLTLTPSQKSSIFIIEPVIWPFSSIHLPFILSLVIAGLSAAFFAFLMGIPVFRVRGDYLAVVTLGFGEIVRVFANNMVRVTNGALGLKGIPQYTNIWWTGISALFTVYVIGSLSSSTYGRALRAIREDEDAAEAMGIDAFSHKMMAFTVSAFFQGLGGGLLAHLLTAISPNLFTFFFTFNLLIMIIVGGLGSTTGAIIGAFLFGIGSEYLRVVEEPHVLFGYHYGGIPGLRMVIFSILLILVMLFARKGIMGEREFSLELVFGKRK